MRTGDGEEYGRGALGADQVRVGTLWYSGEEYALRGATLGFA